MKAIIPTAGHGTRLYPHTHTKPKPMVRLAGQPILGHILSQLTPTNIDDIVIVVGGPMQDQILEYATNEFGSRFEFSFVEQESAAGLGHAIYQAREPVEEEAVLIALGDMLFKNGYDTFLAAHEELEDVDGSIGVKQVDEPQHYGVVEPGEDGYLTSLVEKPDNPPSDLAISGVYIIEDTGLLFDSLEHLISNEIRGAGDEYQLTDALQRMIEQGATLGTFEVDEWYDCGRPETLLEANRVTLSDLETNGDVSADDAVVISPVDIGDSVDIGGSVIGPYVSIDDGTTIHDSIVRDSIIGQNTVLKNVNLHRSLIGDNSVVTGDSNTLNVGDNSEIDL